jgi:hypothetical protein
MRKIMERQYYILTEEECPGTQQLETIIIVTNADYFDTNKYQSDWTDNCVWDVFKSVGVTAGEIMEGVLSLNCTLQEAKNHVKGFSNFQQNAKFTALMSHSIYGI